MISNKELNGLISEHEQYGLMAHRNNNKDALKLIKSVIDVLQELKERRECELRPATKFLNATFEEQLDHVKSEIKEIAEAANDPYYALLDEITDAQHSLQTLKAVIGATREDDLSSHRRVIQKNRVRGYYDVPITDQNKHRELDELSKAAAPLIELMQRKYNPHHKIIVTLDRIEVLSGEIGVPMEVQG